jgi:Cys-rich four helix bundle protein (predicted Tat secretion target)
VSNTENISRRRLLAGAAAVTATVATGNVFASDNTHHHHGANPNTGLIDAALDCIKTGDACSDHCIALVKQGDTSIADCLNSVAETLPMCRALSKLASSESKHLYALAQVCISVCKDCEKECKVHQDKHVECRECMESCAACVKACEKIAA